MQGKRPSTALTTVRSLRAACRLKSRPPREIPCAMASAGRPRDPRTGQDNYAVVQLRRDNAEGTLYNIVGFRNTSDVRRAKARLFHDPGAAERGVCALWRHAPQHPIPVPAAARPVLPPPAAPRIRFAGQMTGVEGYVESCASGALVGIETAAQLLGLPPVDFPQETAIGALSCTFPAAASAISFPG